MILCDPCEMLSCTGYNLELFIDLLRFIEEHKLPARLEDVDDIAKFYTIPLDYGRSAIGSPGPGKRQVHAICMTAKRQLLWIKQLVESQVNYVLHIDGNLHKLHHGKWILMTIGPHVLRHHASKKEVICYDIH